MNTTLLLLIAAQAAAAAGSHDGPHDWPHWRGPERTNVSTETEWTSFGADAPLWRAKLGRGYSSPMVAAGRVFAVGYHASDEDPNVGHDEVVCFDAVTGERRWSVRYPSLAFANEHRGGVIGSPAVAGETLLVATRGGELRALDVATGETHWMVDVAERHGVSPRRYGFASSPYVEDGLVVVCMASAVAFDLVSGETVWVSEDLDANFSTVARMDLPGEHEGDSARPCYAAFGGKGLFVLDATSGETLRTFVFRKSRHAVEGATPVVIGTDVFVSTGYDQGGALVDMAADPPVERWRSRRMRTKLAGATLYEGCLYGHDESMLACIGLDGKLRWRERGLGQGALMIAGDRMLFTTSEGELVVANATESGYEEISRRPVIDEGVFWAAPVLVNGLVYMRGSLGDIVCLDHRGSRAAAARPLSGDGGGDLPPARIEEIYLERTSIAKIAKDGISLRGKLHVVALGVEDSAGRWELSPGGLWHVSFDLPPGVKGTIHRYFDGEYGWMTSPYTGAEFLGDDVVADLRATHGNSTLLDPLPDDLPSKYAGSTLFRGLRCHHVTVQLDSERTRSVYFELQSGHYIGRSAPDETTVVFGDWREVEGGWLPFKRTEFEPDQGLENRWTFSAAELKGPSEDAYVMPAKLRETLK